MIKKYFRRVSVLLVSLLTASIVLADIKEMEWTDAGSGISVTGLHSLAVCPADSSVAYAGSYKVLYRTSDNGKSWAEVLSFRGTGNGINTISTDPLNLQVAYAGTAEGLYRSSDQGLSWERIFKGVGGPENMILTVFITSNNPQNIYIGTRAGILFTEDGGKNWESAQNLPSDVIVTSISADMHDPHVLYAASVRGIYKSIDGGGIWKRIYESDSDENALYNFIIDDEGAAEEVDISGMRDGSHIREVRPDPVDSKRIYAATSRGLLVTNDRGVRWTQTGSTGLASHNIRDIAISSGDPEHVYAATDRGIFRYSRNTDSWTELYKGIVTSDIRAITFASEEQTAFSFLWAVTKTGVYKSALSSPVLFPQHSDRQDVLTDAPDVFRLFNHEPPIEEIKKAAIEYADVSPDKIREWRKAAGKKAWLPDLSMSYGMSEDRQNSSYFYSTKDEKYKDDDITEGDDEAWSISLTWHLGDIIWSDDQTSIDNRSKLMVQLRDDVLNEVTRLYFERRRLQIDLVVSPPGSNKEMIEKDLRLQELTANIDALTGSFLSKWLAQKGIGVQRQD